MRANCSSLVLKGVTFWTVLLVNYEAAKCVIVNPKCDIFQTAISLLNREFLCKELASILEV